MPEGLTEAINVVRLHLRRLAHKQCVSKWALLEFPFAACLTALQFLVSAATVLIAARIFKVIECEPLQWAKVRAFFPAVLLFYFSIFCNTKLLQHATVDTFIVFRSCTPLFVLPLETLVLRTKTGEDGPSTKTYLSLLFIAASSVCYVFVERGGITLTSYFWGAVYLVAIVVDMVVVKKVVTDGAAPSAPGSRLNHDIYMLAAPARTPVSSSFML